MRVKAGFCVLHASQLIGHAARLLYFRAVRNIQFEFEPDRIVGQMDYSYLAEYCHDLESEYG